MKNLFKKKVQLETFKYGMVEMHLTKEAKEEMEELIKRLEDAGDSKEMIECNLAIKQLKHQVKRNEKDFEKFLKIDGVGSLIAGAAVGLMGLAFLGLAKENEEQGELLTKLAEEIAQLKQQ